MYSIKIQNWSVFFKLHPDRNNEQLKILHSPSKSNQRILD